MYLRASDKASGVENFQSAVGSKLIRRELVTKALRQGLSPRHGLEPLHFKYAKTRRSRWWWACSAPASRGCACWRP